MAGNVMRCLPDCFSITREDTPSLELTLLLFVLDTLWH